MNAGRCIGILQPSYLPWLGYFEQMQRADVFVFYDDVQYEKGSWRNRNRIKTPQGPQWLTVPVIQKGLGPQRILDVEVNNRVPWAKTQIKAIRQNYSKAPYFADYSEDLFRLLQLTWRFLVDLNLATTDWLRQALGIQTPTVRASELSCTGGRQERLIDIIKQFDGKMFYEGAAGQSYIDMRRFEAAGVRVVFQDYQHPRYRQLYGDFIPYMSVIDLLFNHGPQSVGILKNGDRAIE